MGDMFSRIYSLLKNKETHSREDYLTEIFSGVFDSSKVVESFVHTFVEPKASYIQLTEAATQRTFPRLDSHETDSRPDLVLCLKVNNQEHIVFFENKLGSQEGSQQLQRYADHLETFRQKGLITHLVYLTQYYDPKDKQGILPQGSTTIFHQLRWYEIYNWLRKHDNDYIVKLVEYMEELGLDQSRKFNPHDMYAIQNMNRLTAMMDECMDGKVEDIMTPLFGKATGRTNRAVQLRDNSRYLKYNDQGNYTAVGIGFYLSEDDYPIVSILFEVNPDCPNRTAIVAALQEFLQKHPEWASEYLDDSFEWCNISFDRELVHFLPEADHIDNIQNFFIDKLKELHELKQSHPEFDWK